MLLCCRYSDVPDFGRLPESGRTYCARHPSARLGGDDDIVWRKYIGQRLGSYEISHRYRAVGGEYQQESIFVDL